MKFNITELTHYQLYLNCFRKFVHGRDPEKIYSIVLIFMLLPKSTKKICC